MRSQVNSKESTRSSGSQRSTATDTAVAESKTWIERRNAKIKQLIEETSIKYPIDTIEPNQFTKLGTGLKWASSLCSHALACNDSSVYSWGIGSQGSLGLNSTVNHDTPKEVFFLKKENIISVSAGNQLSLFLSRDGRLFQCGMLDNFQGSASWRPQIVTGFKDKVNSISTGLQACYAITGSTKKYPFKKENEDRDDQWREGVLFSWGVGRNGQLGHGNEDNFEENPRPIQALLKHRIVQVSAGLHFAVALTSTGRAYSWGKNNNGQLGHGDTDVRLEPACIEMLEPYFILNVSAGQAHVLAIILGSGKFGGDKRTVYSWGRDEKGCLGNCTKQNSTIPLEIQFFRGHYVEKVSAGADHSLVLISAGVRTYMYAFGANTFGQLGIESLDHSAIPKFIRELTWSRIVSISAGYRCSFAVTDYGEVYSWGEGARGLTSQENNRTTFVPWKLQKLEESFVTAISAGSSHVLALIRQGKKMDTLRRFRVTGAAFTVEDKYVKNEVAVCSCAGSEKSIHAMISFFYVCHTCSKTPICRLCVARCHESHDIGIQSLGLSHQECQCFLENNNCRLSKMFSIEDQEDDCTYIENNNCRKSDLFSIQDQEADVII